MSQYLGTLTDSLIETVTRIQGEIVMCSDCPDSEEAHLARTMCAMCEKPICKFHSNSIPGVDEKFCNDCYPDVTVSN